MNQDLPESQPAPPAVSQWTYRLGKTASHGEVLVTDSWTPALE